MQSIRYIEFLTDSKRGTLDGPSFRLSSILSRLPRTGVKGAGVRFLSEMWPRKWRDLLSGETNGTGGTSDSKPAESGLVQLSACKKWPPAPRKQHDE